MRVQVSLRAEKLGNISRGRLRGKRSNPYATVKFADDGDGSGATDLGKTEVILNNLDPTWTQIFMIEHKFSHTSLRITIFDSLNPPPPPPSAHTHESLISTSILSLGRNRTSSDPIMGEVDVEVSEILNMDGQEEKIKLKQGGCIYVHIIESTNPNQTVGSTTCSDTFFSCHLRGLDFKNIESGCLGLGAIDPYFELFKKYCHSSSGITRWHCIYRSEHVPNIINPFWKPFKIELEKLCHGNLQKQLRLAVWDKQGGRFQDRFIGECELKVSCLMDSVTKGGNANREDALDLYDEEMEVTGKIVVLKADLDVIHKSLI